VNLVLTDGERHHPLWLKLAAHLETRVSILRAKNDGPLDALQTATIRGQIKEVKALLSYGATPFLD
jgi:hypothetical protein